MFLRDLFDLCIVINLDRRIDRWIRLLSQLQDLGPPKIVRVSAIDGRSGLIASGYEEYRTQFSSCAQPETPQNDLEFYTGNCIPSHRAQFKAWKLGGPPITSIGAFACLESHSQAVKLAIDSGAERVLILEDDAIFHNRSRELFGFVVEQLPRDWMVLQLGSLQYVWSGEWFVRHSRNLYRNNGATIGSHAIGYRREALLELYGQMAENLLPFDLGPLSQLVQKQSARSFVCYPNTAIQDLTDTDIGSSRHHKADRRELSKKLHWNIDDYVF